MELLGKFAEFGALALIAGYLLAFQFENKLEVDGICGGKTWGALT